MHYQVQAHEYFHVYQCPTKIRTHKIVCLVKHENLLLKVKATRMYGRSDQIICSYY